LNALLPLPEDAPIESLQYLSPEQVPEIPGLLKNSIVDVKCRDAKGRTFIVEMQMLWQTSFEQRMVFSASSAYVKQLRPGDSYDALEPVYALALVNQIFDRNTPEYFHHYKIVHMQQPNKVLTGLEFVFVEIPKFKPTTSTDKRMAVMWLRFLSEVGNDNEPIAPDLQNDPLIKEALQLIESSGFTRDELEHYHQRLDKTRVEVLLMKGAKNEGRAEGRAEGKAEGLAEGLAEGEAQGIAKTLKNMHVHGMSAEQMSQFTGHSVADVLRYLAAP
jgi:predicted transposase/invertase (TIGR01784 family)